MGADGRNVKSISQSRNISAFVPAWSTVFRESIIELGSVAPSSVANPADAVQIIGGRPVIGSERIRRHARRKVREPRPPQRHLSIPFLRHKCLFSAPPRLSGEGSFSTACRCPCLSSRRGGRVSEPSFVFARLRRASPRLSGPRPAWLPVPPDSWTPCVPAFPFPPAISPLRCACRGLPARRRGCR